MLQLKTIFNASKMFLYKKNEAKIDTIIRKKLLLAKFWHLKNNLLFHISINFVKRNQINL